MLIHIMLNTDLTQYTDKIKNKKNAIANYNIFASV